MTRETWLEELVEKLRPIYAAAEVPIPEKVRVACGFPSRNALGVKSRRLGEAWMIESTEDAINQIFVTPLISDGSKVAGILAHELVHCCLPTGAGHKKPFISACKKIGLTDGSPKTAMPGPELQETLDRLLADLPPYPNGAITPKSVDKKQSTRLLKLECIGDSEGSAELHEPYILRGSKKVIDRGLPICPICEQTMKSDDADEDNGEKEDK